MNEFRKSDSIDSEDFELQTETADFRYDLRRPLHRTMKSLTDLIKRIVINRENEIFPNEINVPKIKYKQPDEVSFTIPKRHSNQRSALFSFHQNCVKRSRNWSIFEESDRLSKDMSFRGKFLSLTNMNIPLEINDAFHDIKDEQEDDEEVRLDVSDDSDDEKDPKMDESPIISFRKLAENDRNASAIPIFSNKKNKSGHELPVSNSKNQSETNSIEKPMMKAMIATQLEAKFASSCTAEKVMERCHISGSTRLAIDPNERRKNPDAFHFRKLRERLIVLLGVTSVRINDHESMKRLQFALEKEAERKAEAHEKDLADQEVKRLQRLMVKGAITSEELETMRAKGKRSEIEYQDNFIHCELQEKADRDFRQFSCNPRGAKYNALHLGQDRMQISENLLDQSTMDKMKTQQYAFTDETDTQEFLKEAAKDLRKFNKIANLIDWKSDDSTMLSDSGFPLTRKSFAESVFPYAQQMKSCSSKKMFQIAEKFCSGLFYLDKWPDSATECFAEANTRAVLIRLSNYEKLGLIQPEDESDSETNKDEEENLR